ncbi:DUF454 family protein [Gilliamella apicola]|uniref:DUF454 family protein n=1 Tax=unclassified Gilliamella TaxID=2685620 RepID=UPI0009B8EB3F
MFKKWLFIIIGSALFLLGTVSILVPPLPTVLFYLLTTYFLNNISDRLYSYFTDNHYYQTYI